MELGGIESKGLKCGHRLSKCDEKVLAFSWKINGSTRILGFSRSFLEKVEFDRELNDEIVAVVIGSLAGCGEINNCTRP